MARLHLSARLGIVVFGVGARQSRTVYVERFVPARRSRVIENDR
ncbi:hypothetical protein [Sphingomonas sp. SFZ2018-12]|nr:hypothetical protein [Sphingomonas sp. SFZ2018-12]